MTMLIKTIEKKIEVLKCDICGEESSYEFPNTHSIEPCLEPGCKKDICARHSMFYGGNCVYVYGEGMYCPEHSKGKKCVDKYDVEEQL